MTGWHFEKDYKINRTTGEITTIYRKYISEPTGRDIPCTDFSPGGDDYVQEFERTTSIRISKEEYENRDEE